MARAKVLHHMEDPTTCYGQTQHGKFADPQRVTNCYPHFVGCPDRWNSRLLTREINRAAHLYKAPSKRSTGVRLEIIREVCETVLQAVETLPEFDAARHAVATGTEILKIAEVHVYHQCRLSAEILLSSELSYSRRTVKGRSSHSRFIAAKSILDITGPFVPMHVQFFARVLLKPDTSDESAWKYERRLALVTPVLCEEQNIDGHTVFEVHGDEAPMLIDLELIDRPLMARMTCDACRHVPVQCWSPPKTQP
jgi:hypothetical protein